MQQALIVDDSKTARVMLGKMLSKHQIEVAAVESGEEALDYLQLNKPDVIFMDHMMPGMDGFAAVKAIKSNPASASIPIVMHTTKQGDIYLGQAKALGAMDILAKPAQDQELIAVIKRVEEGAKPKPSADPLLPDESESTASSPRPTESSMALTVERPMVTPADVEARLQSEQLSQASSPVFWGSLRQWLVTLIWLLPILWLLNLHFEQRQQIEQFDQQQYQWIKSTEWLLNQQPAYDYGEPPMSGDRLLLLKGVLEQLVSSGFTGTVRMEGYVGDFCLSLVPLEDGTEMLMLPEPSLPLVQCDVIGLSSAQALAVSGEQSPAFSEFVQDWSAADSGIYLEIVAFGTADPIFPYPDNLSGVTSGDWNTAAFHNNRVKFVLLPN